jgi:aminomethyltransferase
MLAKSFLQRQVKSCSGICKMSTDNLEKTAFYDLHISLGGKMVPFAGYHLPVQYTGLGVLKEHMHTRSANGASLFDVSHMGQIKWHGKDTLKFIETMLVGDVAALKTGETKLSLIMNEKGTIMDDCMVTNSGDHYYMVVNGACKVSCCCLFMYTGG